MRAKTSVCSTTTCVAKLQCVALSYNGSQRLFKFRCDALNWIRMASDHYNCCNGSWSSRARPVVCFRHTPRHPITSRARSLMLARLNLANQALDHFSVPNYSASSRRHGYPFPKTADMSSPFGIAGWTSVGIISFFIGSCDGLANIANTAFENQTTANLESPSPADRPNPDKSTCF